MALVIALSIEIKNYFVLVSGALYMSSIVTICVVVISELVPWLSIYLPSHDVIHFEVNVIKFLQLVM